MVRGAAALLTAPVLATAYFAVAPALPDLGDGDLPLLVADGLGLIAIAATVWSLLPAWRAQNVLAFVLLGAAIVTGILNLAGVGALANVPEASRDAGRGMGMTERQLLWRVELPLAVPEIIAGLRVAVTLAVAAAELTPWPPADPLATALLATTPAFTSAWVTV